MQTQRTKKPSRVGRRNVLAVLGAAAASAVALIRSRGRRGRTGPLADRAGEPSGVAERPRKPPIWIGHL